MYGLPEPKTTNTAISALLLGLSATFVVSTKEKRDVFSSYEKLLTNEYKIW